MTPETPTPASRAEEKSAEESLAQKEEKLEVAVSGIISRERGAYRRGVLITLLSLLLGLGWLLYSGYKVRRLDEEFTEKSLELIKLENELKQTREDLKFTNEAFSNATTLAAEAKEVLEDFARGRGSQQEAKEVVQKIDAEVLPGKVVARSTPTPTPRPTPQSTPRPTPEASPNPTPQETPRPTPTPRPTQARPGFVNSALYRGAAGTTITVAVYPQTASSDYPVRYIRNAVPGYITRDNPLRFTLSGRTHLILAFPNTLSGANYTVRISASDGNSLTLSIDSSRMLRTFTFDTL